MKRNIIILATATVMTLANAATAQAACFAEYKAKRDNPLELFYDVAQISGPCTKANARAQLQQMLARQGLTLLKVLSVKNN
ncbi:hypothetical protein BXY70_3280 [Roseovarius halotolerans]|uniref:SPOR domain-containing protein n=1 Tax=Roseovarius halotolerans TaxID=505353 RepID=A0A1X6ZRI9_9RHOB|nr:hypothetical protein [Roseovarius halotolerans]RKT27924.1 hypothetical protein BXY70_3280 [Roseovarius halotolerans]SLN59440.1 hypothetical protein ROH8110_03320 [Roseovarius halotolerans]